MANIVGKAGDRVLVKTKKAQEEGILMPSSDDKVVIVKLENGYNIGFDQKDVTEMKVVKKKSASDKIAGKKIKVDKNLPTIAVLHTGGTIASKVDYKSGGVIAQFSASDLIAMVPELKTIANVETELVSNMMSEDMFFENYQKLGTAIKKYAEKGVKGIIIGHGTDTLAYTSAALTFMFEQLNIPVMLVGSQRSSDRGSSDAAMNLVCAAEFIAQTDFVGVATCMHHSSGDDTCAIINGTKVRKMHTSRRDAFKAINDTPVALVDYSNRKVKFLKKNYAKKGSNDKVKLLDKFDNKVGLMKTYPNADPRLFEFFTKHYDAFVIEGTGLGHAPTNVGDNLKNYELLKKFINGGGVVAITSQCIYGRVHPSVYTNLRRLADIGCIFCEDMLPETAYIKLAWLMGNYPKEEARKMLAKNLRGEINNRLTFEEDFVEG
ncbi:MAG: Glu-tRNA(Gln) amidotransferase subunit GatD [archaeon]|nr:Glu-tRNA(Gln) amidotransferase subunit GatD [Nanoarchaeota archaeon]